MVYMLMICLSLFASYLHGSNGDGTFQNPWVYQLPPGSRPSGFAIGSFKRGTSGADLITANAGSGTLGVLLNAQTGPPAADIVKPYEGESINGMMACPSLSNKR